MAAEKKFVFALLASEDDNSQPMSEREEEDLLEGLLTFLSFPIPPTLCRVQSLKSISWIPIRIILSDQI